MDPVQSILLIVVVVLAALLCILGVQVYYILKEFRMTLEKANKVLDDATSITENIAGPIAAVSSIAAGIKTGSVIAKLLQKAKNKLTQEMDEE